MTVNNNIIDDSKYDYLFSVEEVNRLVLNGIPFRDAYKTVGEQIGAGTFIPLRTVAHSHEGSIGNLCLHKIAAHKNQILEEFQFAVAENALNKLMQ